MHIFISYSKKDIEFARHVRALLRAEKFAVWMDEEGISGGDEWEATIEKNLTSCAAFVLILSPDARESDWVKNELLLAQKLKKPIFPILLRGDVWWNLAHIQYEEMQKGLQAKLSPKLIARLRDTTPKDSSGRQKVTLRIREGDIREINSDIIVLKYAQNFYGADLAVAYRLGERKISYTTPAPEEYSFVETRGAVRAPRLLFLGTVGLREFTYGYIQDMCARALQTLEESNASIEHLAMTIHGVGFGLDETAALNAQINGYLNAFHTNKFPTTLRQITIVERNPDSVRRMRQNFERVFGDVFERVPGEEWAYEYTVGQETSAPAAVSAQAAQEQPYTFVIMANDPALDDFFYYGIQNAVHGMGDLCVRMELTLNDAESMSQIKQKIDGAHMVIADLTGATTPTLVYLGYAWGKNHPTIMVKQKNASSDLPADDMLTYERIRDLEDSLRARIDLLKLGGRLSS